MAENTDAQVIAWANQRLRPIANEVEKLKYMLDAYINDYGAQTIVSLINQAGASLIIADGSDSDGRPQVTGTMVINAEAAFLQLQTAINTTLVTGVGSTVHTILSAIQTNNGTG